MNITLKIAKDLVLLTLSFFLLYCSFSIVIFIIPIILFYLTTLFMLIFLASMKRWARIGSNKRSDSKIFSENISKDLANIYVPYGVPLYHPIRNFMFSRDSNMNFDMFIGESTVSRTDNSTDSTRITEDFSQINYTDSYNMSTETGKLEPEALDMMPETMVSHPLTEIELKTAEENEDFYLDMLFNLDLASGKSEIDMVFESIAENNSELVLDSNLDIYNHSESKDIYVNDKFSSGISENADFSTVPFMNAVTTESSVKSQISDARRYPVLGETKVNLPQLDLMSSKADVNVGQVNEVRSVRASKMPMLHSNTHPTLLRSKTDALSNWHSLSSRQLPCVTHPLSPNSKFFCSKPSKSENDLGSEQRKPEGFEGMQKTNKASKTEKLEKRYEDYAKSKPDTIHFMKTEEPFTRPIESQISSYTHSQASSEPRLPHPIWDDEAVNSVKITHFKPKNFSDLLAFISVKILRALFDLFSGYSLGYIDERGWINRIVFLETIAGVPGMVGAMIRHLNSLRRMEKDYGWIHVLLEEAENERMHLMTAILLKKPSKLFRFGIITTQAFFLTIFSISYFLFPQFSHRIVGYFEEEAVRTYSKLIHEIDQGHLPLFTHQPAPPVAIEYWKLDKDAKLREVFLAIRADESHHREVNHSFASISQNDKSPF